MTSREDVEWLEDFGASRDVELVGHLLLDLDSTIKELVEEVRGLRADLAALPRDEWGIPKIHVT